MFSGSKCRPLRVDIIFERFQISKNGVLLKGRICLHKEPFVSFQSNSKWEGKQIYPSSSDFPLKCILYIQKPVYQNYPTWITALYKSLFFFNQKILIFFLLLYKNICCGYSLEAPRGDTSIEYPQFIFSLRNKETIYLDTPVYKYSWLSLSRPRLSRITAYLEVKIWSLPIHENLTTDGKYCRKEEKLLLRSNFSSFPQYFQYISNFKSPITYQFVKCG